MLLRWLISTIGLAALKGEATAIARRAARRAMLFVVLMIVWLAAVGFAVAALTIWLAGMLGGLAACCILAGVLLLIGLALLLGISLSSRSRERVTANLGGAMPNLGTPDLTTFASIAAIAVAGYLVGRQIFRR
jgi:hypothetical protein